MVLGIDDPWVWSAYILTILSMLLCVVYGALNWNKGDEDEEEQIKEEIEWHKKEKEMEEKELGIWDEEG
ncbi:symporter small accessory protein [Methanobacterium sp.]|uniref:symporter small accessory protein n=1 Tax=Methanobacterium sp. TaxID=2164 RepID=UPI003C7950D2